MVPLFLGTALGIVGGLLGGFGKKKQANAQAEAARLNAQQVRERADIETTLRARAGGRESGAVTAAAGANNLAAGGSASDILRESARNTEFDLTTIRTQSDLEAKALEKGAKATKKAGTLGFASSVIGSAASILGG